MKKLCSCLLVVGLLVSLLFAVNIHANGESASCVCPTCSGLGEIIYGSERCSRCNGSGKIPGGVKTSRCQCNQWPNTTNPSCKKCGGTGWITEGGGLTTCFFCDGVGIVPLSITCSTCKGNGFRHSGGEATCISKAVCSVCGEPYGNTNTSNHINTSLINSKPATESEEGYTGDLYCNDCEQYLEYGAVIEKLDHAHTGITYHEAVAATCRETGTIEYWTCASPKCSGKYYSDAACQHEITDGITLPKDSENHIGGTEYRNAQAATCLDEGYEGDIYCLGCGEKIGEGESVGKLAHTSGSDWKADVTYHWKECTADGCGAVIDSTKEAHDFSWVTDREATEDEEGIRHEECTVCGYRRNDNTPIEKLDHTHTGITYHEAVAATCRETGTIEYWTCASSKCSGKYYSDAACQHEITDGITLPKDSENHIGGTEYRNAREATCCDEGYEGDIVCLGCGEKIGEGETIEKLEHQNTELRNKKDATATEDGYTGDLYCKDCEEMIEEGEVIKAIGNSSEDEEPADEGSEHRSTSPKTGVQTTYTVWILLASLSLAMIVVLTLTKKKAQGSR